MNVLIYDSEIIKCIPDPRKINLAHLEYCEGWEDHKNMGISVIGTYRFNKKYNFEAYEAFSEDYININNLDFNTAEIEDFDMILSYIDVIVGFNNQHFDDNLLKANGFIIPENVINYDLLAEIWEAAGLGRTFEYPSHTGFSLDAICRANGLGEKSGTGTLAPELWQKGKKQEVIEYCMNDIKLTKALFDLIQEKGEIRDPRQYNKYFIKYNPDFEFKPLKVKKLKDLVK